jgi:hypothetical protein
LQIVGTCAGALLLLFGGPFLVLVIFAIISLAMSSSRNKTKYSALLSATHGVLGVLAKIFRVNKLFNVCGSQASCHYICTLVSSVRFC